MYRISLHLRIFESSISIQRRVRAESASLFLAADLRSLLEDFSVTTADRSPSFLILLNSNESIRKTGLRKSVRPSLREVSLDLLLHPQPLPSPSPLPLPSTMLRTPVCAVASSSKHILSSVASSPCLSSKAARVVGGGRRWYSSPSTSDKASVSVGMVPPREVESDESKALGNALDEILLTPSPG